MRTYDVIENELYIGGVSARDLILKFGSPLYVYDESIIKERVRKLLTSVQYENLRIHYAMKANSNLRILELLRKEGCYIDAVSQEEVLIALKAGFPPQKILYTAINLSLEDMWFAVKHKIRLNIGSLIALEIFGEYFPGSSVSIRINPDFGAGHHDHCVTGGRESKFGIFYSAGEVNDLSKVPDIIAQYNLKLVGIHAHIGSGILDETKYIELMKVILGLAKGFPGLEFIDFGGGIGVPYMPEEKDFDLQAFGSHLDALLTEFTQEYGSKPAIALEPGRFLVAESGYLLATITDIKKTPKFTFIGIDSGFNHLIRPMAYGSYHGIINASNVEDTREEVAVSGYLCESGDVFTRNEEGIVPRLIPNPEIGNILALMNAGAYGYSMASNYNSRPKPAEVMVSNGKGKLIRRRETLSDILKTQI